jgi:hypothetical protein
VRLLVEGPDDKHVISHLLLARYRGYERIKVTDHGGIEPLLEELSVFLKGTENFGIVLDANDSINNRWDAVRNRAIQAGYTVSATPEPAGTVITTNAKPRFGVWIMPDNQMPGMLEDFVGRLVPEGDGLWPMADEVVKNIPEERRRFRPKALLKAIVHTWLAWQEEPGTPMGAAINQRYLRNDSELADRFIAWVARLESPGSDQPPVAQR